MALKALIVYLWKPTKQAITYYFIKTTLGYRERNIIDGENEILIILEALVYFDGQYNVWKQIFGNKFD